MRTALYFGRLCLRRKPQRLIGAFARHERHFSIPASWPRFQKPPQPATGVKLTLLSLLSPAAFVALSEEDDGDGKTPEEHMLEASRAEIAKEVPEDTHGIKRLWKAVYLVAYTYIVEPIATTGRFLHLVIIFVPVIATIPALWFGRRQKDRDNERIGTLWWYSFLVHSMERAGPAFIKVQDTRKEHAILADLRSSWVSGLHRDQTSSLGKCAVLCHLSTPTLQHIP